MSSRLGEGATYEVRVLGRLDERWSDWLNGVTIACEGEEDGRETTILIGHLDQAGLRGLLNRIGDLNLAVVSIGLLDRTAALLQERWLGR
jgi:hypothetical protein